MNCTKEKCCFGNNKGIPFWPFQCSPWILLFSRHYLRNSGKSGSLMVSALDSGSSGSGSSSGMGHCWAPPRGGTCSLDPLIFLDFIPCSPLIKPLVPKNVFSSCSLDPENFCVVPLIPKNVYHCSPYLFACFTFLFIVEKNRFRNISFFSLESAHALLHRLPFQSSQ